MAKQSDQDELNSILGMSDEELMKLDPSTLTATQEVVEEESKDEVADEAVAESADTESEASDAKEDDAEDKEESKEASEDAAESEDKEDDKEAEDEQKSPDSKAKPDQKPDAEAKPDKTVEAESVDYKAAYERILAPFKANGRDIAVKSVDDAIALMQMGANYSKKMAALKPNLKLLKLLENNGLLNEERISFLIDVEKKNPSAINKLVKDSGIDPMDLDAEKAGDYKPNTYSVDDREMELEAVLEEIQDTPTYARTLEVVSKVWDGQSKQVIASSPQLLKVINDHMNSGIYDLISKEIENERVFGRLKGLSDIEAYRQVGDSIQARGGFAHLGRQGQQTSDKPVVVTPKPKMVDEAKLRDKKRAASSTKPAAPSSQIAKDFNPLALSDEEFSKAASLKY